MDGVEPDQGLKRFWDDVPIEACYRAGGFRFPTACRSLSPDLFDEAENGANLCHRILGGGGIRWSSSFHPGFERFDLCLD